MNCYKCGYSVDPQNKFCGECGSPVNSGFGHAVNTGGGDIGGDLYIAGRDVVVSPVLSSPVSATYEAVPKWRSPFTQGVLSWLGLALGLAGVFPLWKMLQPVLSFFNTGLNAPASNSDQIWWIWLFILLFFLLIAVIALRHLAELQLRKPLFLGWALSGVGRRITLEKVRVGRCPQCGGKMRYYNKPTKWIDYIYTNSKKWREITERSPALECKRNPKHWYEIDPAEAEAM